MTEPSDLRATRAAYDTVAADYADVLRGALAESPFDRAMLAAFADLVRAADLGPVLDVGCGPGRITAHLHALGLGVSGVDLSPAMVAVARRDHPGLRFAEGSMSGLDVRDGTLGGVVAWYSTIHTPPERLPAVFAEFHRVLAPGGALLLAFQVGDGQRMRLEQAYGHTISLDVYRRSPDVVADLLDGAGLVVHARLLREPEGREKSRQAYLMARKPSS